MGDKFPEAFRRFENKVDTSNIETWRQLQLVFASWAGGKWRPTWRQTDALHVQARRLGIPTQGYRTREQEVHRIFGQQQRSMFSSNYMSFNVWQERTKRTTAYERRIINYLRSHPDATLRDARGHRKKR